MDFEYAKRKRKWAIVLGAFGFTCYGAYRVYNLPSLVNKRQRLLKLFSALFSLADMVSNSADAIGILSKDLNHFLRSDSDQIPQSLKQLSKIAKSDQLSGSFAAVARAVAVGIFRGCRDGNGDCGGFVDKLFSEAGSGFASAVAGSFAKNLVMTLFSEWEGQSLKSVGKWVGIVCDDDKCRELIGDVVRLFVSTAVTVYLEKTRNINTYDDFFDGLTNPKHEARVREMLVTLCNGAVETCVQTSYGVWATNPTRYGVEDGVLQGKKSSRKARNRKLLLDVSFESVRSFLQYLLEKVMLCVKTSMDVGIKTMRYVSVKSCAVTSVCLTLCLNIVNSPWLLAPN